MDTRKALSYQEGYIRSSYLDPDLDIVYYGLTNNVILVENNGELDTIDDISVAKLYDKVCLLTVHVESKYNGSVDITSEINTIEEYVDSITVKVGEEIEDLEEFFGLEDSFINLELEKLITKMSSDMEDELSLEINKIYGK